MKCILVALLAALVATVSTGSVVFTVPLPSGPSQSQFFTGGSGDMYFTVGAGGSVYGVNLTSKALQYTRDFDGQQTIAGIIGVGTMGQVLIQQQESIISFDGAGNFLWESSEFAISARAHSYTVIDSTLFIASLQSGTFNTVDLTTGRISTKNQMEIAAGSVYADKAVLTVYNENDSTDLVSYSLPSLTKMWEVKNVDAFLAMNSQYLLVTNASSQGYTDVLVLDTTSYAVKLTLHSMEGVSESGFTPVIKGDHALFVQGEETQRLTYYSLTTGFMEWDLFLGENNGGGSAPAIINGDALVTISQTKLTSVNLTTGKAGISIDHVPYTSAHTITSMGGNKVQVANLQGYTEWDLSTGAYIGRNEMSPSATLMPPYMWNGLSISTQGAMVVASN